MDRYVKNKRSRLCKAFCLGAGSPLEESYLEKGLIIHRNDNLYEIFTKETKEKGELAETGDFVKIGQDGEIYPNKRDYFLNNHKKIQADMSEELYEQNKSVVWVAFWEDFQTPIEKLPEELRFLIRQKGLKINSENEREYYEAEIWGTYCYAKKDAAVVIHRKVRDDEGKIADIRFQFVDKDIFDDSYEKYVPE